MSLCTGCTKNVHDEKYNFSELALCLTMGTTIMMATTMIFMTINNDNN